jgi:hypothetical protein
MLIRTYIYIIIFFIIYIIKVQFLFQYDLIQTQFEFCIQTTIKNEFKMYNFFFFDQNTTSC